MPKARSKTHVQHVLEHATYAMCVRSLIREQEMTYFSLPCGSSWKQLFWEAETQQA